MIKIGFRPISKTTRIFLAVLAWQSILSAQHPLRLNPGGLAGQTTANSLVHALSPICFDGPVRDLIADNGKLFVGGEFQSAGTCSGSFVAINAGNKKNVFPTDLKVDGEIYVILPDGVGGWFIGGDFSRIGIWPRENVARLGSDFSLDLTFVANTNGKVKSMSLLAAKLYMVGEFTEVNSLERSRYAVVNSITGSALSEVANANKPLNHVQTSGGYVYVSGSHDAIGTSALIPGAITDITNPNSITSVPTITGFFDGSNIAFFEKAIDDGAGGWIIVGSFSTVSGSARNGVARINADGTLHTGFDPVIWSFFNSENIPNIQSVVREGSKIWIVGDFAFVNGDYHPKIVALDIDTGDVVSNSFCPVTALGGIQNVTVAGGTIYMSGGAGFHGGTCYGMLGAAAISNGSAQSAPITNGPVFVGIEDGSGGIFIGGSFDRVDGEVRTGFAQVDSSGDLTTANLALESANQSPTVRKLLKVGDTLFILGDFNKILGENRDGLAAVDLNTWTLISWNPTVSGRLEAFAQDGTNLYVAGEMAITVGLESRVGVASFDLATLSLRSWSITSGFYGSAATFSEVFIYSGNVYLMGRFDNINGVARTSLASVSTASATLDSWNPNLDGHVNFATLAGDQLFIGGEFWTVNGSGRNSIASFTLSNGNLTSWNPAWDNYITSFASDGTYLYAFGIFSSIASTSRPNGAARFSLATRAIDSWTANLNIPGSAGWIFREGFVANGSVYISNRDMMSSGGSSRNSIAAFDTTTYAIKTFNIASLDSNYINTMVADGSRLYIAGGFTTVGGSGRNGVAAFNTSTSALLSWNPSFTNGGPSKFISDGTDFYVTGNYTEINGQPRPASLSSFSLSTGSLTSFNPSLVSTEPGSFNIAVDATRVIVAGKFEVLNAGVPIHGIASLNKADGSLLNWNLSYRPQDDSGNFQIRAIAISGSNVFFGGSGYYGGTQSSYLSQLDSASIPQNWFPKPNGVVTETLIDGTGLFLAGSFSEINGSARQGMGKISLIDASLDGFVADVTGVINAMVLSGSNLYLGGSFTDINNVNRTNLAVVSKATGNLGSWAPTADQAVETLHLEGSSIFVGGSFDEVNATPRKSIAELDLISGQLSSWSYDLAGDIFDLDFQSGHLMAVGSISSTLPQSRKGLALLDESSGNLLSWNAGLDAGVSAFAKDGSNLYVAGSFTTAAGLVRKSLASFSLASLALQPLSFDFDAGIEKMKLGSDTLWLAGGFTTVNGQARNLTAAISIGVSPTLTSWDPQLSAGPQDMEIVGTTLWITGWIYGAYGGSANGLIAVDTTTGNRITIAEPSQNDGFITTVFSPTHLYAFGSWNYYNGRTSYFIESKLSDQTLTAWNPSYTFAEVYPFGGLYFTRLALDGNLLYIMNSLGSFEGETRSGGTYVVDLNTKTLTSTNFAAKNGAFKLYRSGVSLYYFGDFKSFENLPRHGLYLGY